MSLKIAAQRPALKATAINAVAPRSAARGRLTIVNFVTPNTSKLEDYEQQHNQLSETTDPHSVSPSHDKSNNLSMAMNNEVFASTDHSHHHDADGTIHLSNNTSLWGGADPMKSISFEDVLTA